MVKLTNLIADISTDLIGKHLTIGAQIYNNIIFQNYTYVIDKVNINSEYLITIGFNNHGIIFHIDEVIYLIVYHKFKRGDITYEILD